MNSKEFLECFLENAKNSWEISATFGKGRLVFKPLIEILKCNISSFIFNIFVGAKDILKNNVYNCHFNSSHHIQVEREVRQ